MDKRIFAFEPIVDDRSRVLILGSMPSKLSLEANEYYANPKNQFWEILSRVLQEPLPNGYDEKLTMLHKNHIALWDVIGHCLREGSLDSAIRDAQVNDFNALFHRYPNICCIVFNGSKAYETYFKKVNPHLPEIRNYKLPSTSPAMTKPFAWKLEQWLQLRECLK